MVDFSILVGTFGVCEGDGGSDPKADFNQDGCVNIVDFFLLSSNFGTCGDCETVESPLSLNSMVSVMRFLLVLNQPKAV